MPVKLSLYRCLADGGCNIQKPKCWAQQAGQAGCASLRPVGLPTENETFCVWQRLEPPLDEEAASAWETSCSIHPFP